MDVITCAISGEIPREPVLARTGYVFEKDLILKHLEVDQRCPVTDEVLSINDLAQIQTTADVKNYVASPRFSNVTSIPSMLRQFETEWQSLVTENFEIRKELEKTRHQLAMALHQREASTRVIAKLREEAAESLDKLREFSFF